MLVFAASDTIALSLPLLAGASVRRAGNGLRSTKEPVIASAIPEPPQLSISTASEGDHTVVALHGELDVSSSELVYREVADLRRVGIESLVLDLRGLTFLDSTGLQVLLALRNDAKRARRPFSLVPGSPDVQRVFTLTATRTLFDWRPARDTSSVARADGLQRLLVETREQSLRFRTAEQHERGIRGAH